MTASPTQKRIIALDIRSRSFGFAIFEGPNELLDFGARSFRGGKNTVQVPPIQKLAALFDDFRPDAVVRENRAQRRKWTSIITDAFERESRKRGISIISITRDIVRQAFVDRDRNKYEIASALARQFPALALILPPKRKCWQSEDYRMRVFDAVALGVGYFARYGKRTPTTPGNSIASSQSAR